MSVSIKVEVSKRLKDWRMLTATTNNVELYRILHNETINQIANDLPETNIELLAIKGLGPAKVKKYGSDILKIVTDCKSLTVNKSVDASEDSMSVSQFLTQINFSLAKHTVRVRGEVYGSVDQRGKAIYFKIKDSENNALLSCFSWTNTFEGKGVYPKEGAEVILEGQAQIYPPTGRFSLQVKLLELRGEGLLRQAYEKLKLELEKSGAFNQDLKRPLPKFPRRIAVVTATDSDAETDFLTHVKDHGLVIDRYDVRVEGIKSESEIVSALKTISQSNTPYDLVVITRGGGSLEALQGYNSKSVVEAVQSCRYPVVSAVGHEKDVTLCDLVADVRVSTPTDAGKLIDRIYLDLFESNQRLVVQINHNIQTRFESMYQKISKPFEFIARKIDININGLEKQVDQSYRTINDLNHYLHELSTKPVKQIDQIDHIFSSYLQKTESQVDSNYFVLQQLLKGLLERLSLNINFYDKQVSDYRYMLEQAHNDYYRRVLQLVGSIRQRLEFELQKTQDEFAHHFEVLSSYNPDTILKRGYSIIIKGDKTITSSNQIKPGDQLKIRLIDGTVKATSN